MNNTAVGAAAPLPDDLHIIVCGNCRRASCWHDVLLCDHWAMAPSVRYPVSELRRMNLESPDYWERDQRAIAWRKQMAAVEVGR